jgi:hypothetical protein
MGMYNWHCRWLAVSEVKGQKMIYSIFIFILLIIVKLAFDVRLWLNNRQNRHRWAWLVAIVLLVCSWQAGWESTGIWFFWYWIIFDGMYNILIGEKWWYIGETAWLDKMQRIYPFLVYVKYAGAILSIIFYAYR